MDILLVFLLALIVGFIVYLVAKAIEPTRKYAELIGLLAGALVLLTRLF